MLHRIRKQLFDVRRGETTRVVSLSLLFFLVIAVFWVLKPMKRGLLLSFYADAPLQVFGLTLGGAEAEQLAKALNVVGAYGLVVMFTLVSRQFGRSTIYVLAAVMAGLMGLFAHQLQAPASWTVWAFYFFGDLFNTLMVAAFWTFASDVIRPDQARRLYGPIGLGGVVGGFIGATVVRAHVASWGRPALLLLCIGAMACIALAAFAVNARSHPAADDTLTTDQAPIRQVIFDGMRRTLRSRYLLAIMALVGLYEIVSNIVDFQLATMVEAHIQNGASKDAFFGLVGQVTGVVSILVQVLLTGWVMTRFGVGVALLILPVSLLLGSVGFLAVPALGVATALSASDNALNYSINQSAKEALYTPTSRVVKYRAKAFIDMFVQRFAKGIAVALNLGFAVFVGVQGVRWLALLSIGLLIAWVLVVRFAGRRFQQKTTGTRARPTEPSPRSRQPQVVSPIGSRVSSAAKGLYLPRVGSILPISMAAASSVRVAARGPPVGGECSDGRRVSIGAGVRRQRR